MRRWLHLWTWREGPSVKSTIQIMLSEWYCHAPSWLDLGELSHMHIHLTMDHDSTQLNAPPCMGNTEYSPTQTSLTSMDISRQAWHVDSAHAIFIHLAYNTL